MSIASDSTRHNEAARPKPSRRRGVRGGGLRLRLERARLAALAGDQERDQAAGHEHAGPGPQRRHEPVDERLRRLEAAGSGEDGRQHGHAEDAAELADRVVGAGRLAGLLHAHGAEHRVRGGCEHQRHPGAADDERGHEHAVGDVGLGDGGEPHDRGRLEEEARGHQRARADAVGQQPGDRRHDHRHAGPGQRPQPGLERRIALDGLEELGQQEDRAEDAERHRERDAVRGRELARAEEAQRQHRRLRAQLPGDERGQQHSARGDRRDDLGRAPAHRVAAHDAVDDAEQAGRGERQAGQVQRAGRAVALAQAARGERREREADRDVEPEDPLPRDPLDHGAADERAERDAEPADTGPDAERQPALLGRRAGAQQRQAQRCEDRGS